MTDTSEHLVAIVSFEGALKREAKRLRQRLQRIENLPSMALTISCSGRLHDGDLKLKYRLDETVPYMSETDCVVGDTLTAVVEEFERRHGWAELHAPKAIGYEHVPGDDSGADTVGADETPTPPPAPDNDDIPF